MSDRLVRSAHSPAMPVQKFFETPSLTKQSHKDECDVNMIMVRFEKTGLIDHINQFKGGYGDAIGVVDYHTAQNQIIAADAAFLSLPAKLRARFHNDPGAFLSFADNPANAKELAALTSDKPTGARIPPASAGGPDPGDPPQPTEKPPEAPTPQPTAA